MRLGTCLPLDEQFKTNNDYILDRQLEALANAGIRGCLTQFPIEESLWEKASQDLQRALRGAGVTLLEYNSTVNMYAASREQCAAIATQNVKTLAIAESTGCLNVVSCVVGPESILPHPYNRSQDSHDRLKEICNLTAEGAAKLGVRAQLLLEPVYTTLLWSPLVLARFIDEVGSPTIQAHMDMANFYTYDVIFDQVQFIRDAFIIVGQRIHSAHIKDVAPARSYFPGLTEKLVGEGIMDFHTYLGCLGKIPGDMPVLIEHVATLNEITRSYQRIKAIAEELNLPTWSLGSY